MTPQVLSMLLLAGAGLWGWMLFRGIRAGRIEFPQTAVEAFYRRDEQPVRFWLTAVVLGALTVGCLAAAIGLMLGYD